MSSVVNLNQFRKTSEKTKKRKKAKENRESFGRTKAEKDLAREDSRRTETEHDGKKLTPESPEEI
jgi:hypothetical protein